MKFKAKGGGGWQGYEEKKTEASWQDWTLTPCPAVPSTSTWQHPAPLHRARGSRGWDLSAGKAAGNGRARRKRKAAGQTEGRRAHADFKGVATSEQCQETAS